MITVEVPNEVLEALAQQARALLMTRTAYVRAVLATVAMQAQRPIRQSHKRKESC
jgi:hypothetical protein